MAIDWRKYLLQAGQEVRIIGLYSIIIAIFSLSLLFLQWDFDWLIALINLLVLFAIAHREDRTIVDLPWRESFIRFTIAAIVYLTSTKAALTLKSNYLAGDLDTYDSDSDRPNLIMLTVVVEYLDTLRFISSARIYILAVFLILFAAPVVTSAFTVVRSAAIDIFSG